MHASRNSLTRKPIRCPYKKQRKTPIFPKFLFEILTHTMLPSKLLIVISALTFLAFPRISTFARIVFDILTRARPENLPKNVIFFWNRGRGKGFPAQGVAGRRNQFADTEHCEDDAEDDMAESTKWMMCEGTGPMDEVQGLFN